VRKFVSMVVLTVTLMLALIAITDWQGGRNRAWAALMGISFMAWMDILIRTKEKD
jgi:hypothetical protein